MGRISELAQTLAVVRQAAPQSPSAFRLAALFAIFLALAVQLQFLAGAFTADLSGYPDEPAHFVTSEMVRDYVAHGFPAHPLEFAKNFYLHYPKVGLGHWPPLFYAITGVWMLAAPQSKPWTLLLMALFTATTAFVLSLVVGPRHGWIAGVAIGTAFILIPNVQAQTGMVMLEILLTLLSFAATYCYSRFLAAGNLMPSFGFGVFSALAILTKGNGWALALIPPFAIAICGRWRLIRGANFYLAVVPVFFFCLPWQILTRGMTTQGWEQPAPTIAYTVTALIQFVQVFFVMSPVLFVLAVVGIAAAVILKLARRESVDPLHGSMLALLLAVWIFHSVVPAGVEDRKMIMALPALLLFSAEGFASLRRLVHQRAFLLAGAVAVLFFAFGFFVPAKEAFGFARAASDIAQRPDLQSSVSLVSSDGDGEGLFISEFVLRRPHPERYILRGTKVLADSDWSGEDYHAYFHNTAEMKAALDNLQVGILIIDNTPGRFHFEHQRVLLDLLSHDGRDWTLAETVPSPHGGGVAIYRRSAPLPSAQPHLDLNQMLRRTLRF